MIVEIQNSSSKNERWINMVSNVRVIPSIVFDTEFIRGAAMHKLIHNVVGY